MELCPSRPSDHHISAVQRLSTLHHCPVSTLPSSSHCPLFSVLQSLSTLPSSSHCPLSSTVQSTVHLPSALLPAVVGIHGHSTRSDISRRSDISLSIYLYLYVYVPVLVRASGQQRHVPLLILSDARYGSLDPHRLRPRVPGNPLTSILNQHLQRCAGSEKARRLVDGMRSSDLGGS